MNIENLTKLAAYLESMPEEYRGFNMGFWLREAETKNEYRWPPVNTIFTPYEARYHCGTVGCAVGHGPMAGIRANPGELWDDYSERVFDLEVFGPEWTWCFDADWSSVDNTPQGAAKRIRYLLEHGLPHDARSQRLGYNPVSY